MEVPIAIMRYRPRVGVRAVVSVLVAMFFLLAISATPSIAAAVQDLRTNQLATPGWILTGHTPTYADTYALDNTGATVEQGEPTEGGILTRSIWSQFSPT